MQHVSARVDSLTEVQKGRGGRTGREDGASLMPGNPTAALLCGPNRAARFVTV